MESNSLEYFLKEKYIKMGFELLKKQIVQTSYSFKALDFEVYRREEKLDSFCSAAFFENYIIGNQIYNQNSLIYNISYKVPKNIIGLREYSFLSFGARVIYYAIVIYLAEVLKDSIETINTYKFSKGNIFAYYGGNIKTDNIASSELYYQNDFKTFNEKLKSSVDNDFRMSDLVVYNFDIKDYYNTIDHTLLLEYINKTASGSSKRRLNYDTKTQYLIKEFLFFLMKRHSGLPISSQNLPSNFLGYVFLFSLDDFVVKLMNRKNINFSYHRYVDDIFLVAKYGKSIQHTNESFFDYMILLSNFLNENLNLSLNDKKCKFWLLQNKISRGSFISENKFLSFDGLKTKKNISNKLDEITDILEKIKQEHVVIDRYKNIIDQKDALILKECFSRSIKAYLKSPSVQNKLNILFQDWPPYLVLTCLKPIMFMLLQTISGRKSLCNYLIRKLTDSYNTDLADQHVYFLIERTLLHQDFCQSSMRRKLEKKLNETQRFDDVYLLLLKRMISTKGNSQKIKKEFLNILGHNLSYNETLFKNNSKLNEQVKYMVISEIRENFSLALNHLINSFQIYCFIIHNKNFNGNQKQKDYDQTKVIGFLTTINAIGLREACVIHNIFDRRHRNTVSHSSEDKLEGWLIKKPEYLSYKNNIKLLISQINKVVF